MGVFLFGTVSSYVFGIIPSALVGLWASLKVHFGGTFGKTFAMWGYAISAAVLVGLLLMDYDGSKNSGFNSAAVIVCASFGATLCLRALLLLTKVIPAGPRA